MFVNAQLRRAAILGGNRIPFARSNAAYATASNQQTLTAALQGLTDRSNLHDQRLDEVVVGVVIKHTRGSSLTHETVPSTTLVKQTPAYDIQQACGTGLEAAILVANKIALGQIDVGIAGGMDTTPDTPAGPNEKMRKILPEANRVKPAGACVKAPAGLRPSMFVCPPPSRNSEPHTGLSMGEHCELMAKCWGTHREDQDVPAPRSHHSFTIAYERGFFTDLMTAHLGPDRDNNLRSNLTIEQLAKLQPVFDYSAAGTMTAGNSTSFTNGAPCVLLASEDWVRAHNLPVFVYITCADTTAVDFFSNTPEQNGGLLIAPAYAVLRMLQHAGLTLQGFDYYEIHEAFAVQVLSTLAAWESSEYCHERLGRSAPMGSVGHSKPNVNDSSLGTGHPLAATGGRIVATLAKMLAQCGNGRGLVSICAVGGQGVVAILERSETMSH